MGAVTGRRRTARKIWNSTEPMNLDASLWSFGALAIVAGAVAAVSGFGIGSLLTPFLMLKMPAPQAVAIVAIPHIWATSLRLFQLRKEIDWPTFRQFGIASAIGGLAGAAAQPLLGSTGLTLAMALLLVLAGGAELARKPLPLPHSPPWRMAEGMLSGFFGGLVGNQGGIRSAALLGLALEPRVLVATATATAMLVDCARVPVYLLSAGDVLGAAVPLWGAGIVGVTLGTYLGVPILGRIPARGYRRLLGALLVALGLVLAATAVG